MTPDEQKMLQECLDDDSDRLTAWEVEFLESLSRLPDSRSLSDKQRAVLERINSKVLG
jgi:hypothetical protein